MLRYAHVQVFACFCSKLPNIAAVQMRALVWAVLGVCRYTGLGSEDLERAPAWQGGWTEEAVLHYLNMLGYEVPLKMEDSLLQEDAIAIAAQDAAVKFGGQLSKEAMARIPPVMPGLCPAHFVLQDQICFLIFFEYVGSLFFQDCSAQTNLKEIRGKC